MATRLTQLVADAFLAYPPKTLGVAVSGGGDSMALLHLLHGFCTLHGTRLRAVTVDHGIRPEASDEAKMVARYCSSLGVLHETLLWTGWDGTGNLQSAARNARYSLMAEWAERHKINTIALGHTADDQAETFLMRLAREAGVNGLAGMSPRTAREGVTFVRPLLSASREALRTYLRQQSIDWIEDPSNEDTRFERVRARKVMAALEPLGITPDGLAAVAGHMAKARGALDWQTFIAARDLVAIEAGAVVIVERKMRTLPEEIQRRLLVQAIGWITSSSYPPRRSAIAMLIEHLRKGQATTLDGCHIRRIDGQIWIFRELNAVRDISTPPNGLWDSRWRLSRSDNAPPDAGLSVKVLGNKGLEQCPNWREIGLPHQVLLSTPAVWKGSKIMAAPLAGLDADWHAEIEGGQETFFAALLSH